jgi:hypothetical protein
MNQDVMWSKRDRDAGEHYLFGTEPNRFLAHRSRTAAGWKHSLVGPEDRKRQFAAMKQFTRPGGHLLPHGCTPSSSTT